MTPNTAGRWGPVRLRLGLCAIVAALGGWPEAHAATRDVDPAMVVPLDRIAPGRRDDVAEVIREHTFRRKGSPDTFECDASVYLGLLNEPTITLALWKDLSPSPVRLAQIGPNQYQGTDGAGAVATWEFAHRSPELHVLYSELDYTGPRGNAKLHGRIVLVARATFLRGNNGSPYVRHDVEAFVKVDSKGWKAAARTVRPIIEKLLEDQVQEAGMFISLMGRLVETYPDWASKTALAKAEAPAEVRQSFANLVQKARKPNASPGRPVVASHTPPDAPTRRR